jgi:integrase
MTQNTHGLDAKSLAIGEHTPVTVTARSGAFAACAKVRGLDGVARDIDFTAATEADARAGLDRLLASHRRDVPDLLTGDSTVEELAAAWLDDLETRDELGEETRYYYRRGVHELVLPGLRGYRLNELRAGVIKDLERRVLRDYDEDGNVVLDADGNPVAKRSRPVWLHKVLSQMLRYAVEVDALPSSPMRDLRPPPRNVPEPRALTVELFREIRAVLVIFDQRPTYGRGRVVFLVDIFDVMAGTGGRIGEVLALRRCDVDLDAPKATVTICGRLLPAHDGLPLRRAEGTKTSGGVRIVTIPPFAVETLRRVLASSPDGAADDPVFMTSNGTWFAPHNVRRSLGQCRKGKHWDWVKPHTFRKTVATLIDVHYSNPDDPMATGRGATIAAAVLGHSNETVTKTHYIQKMRGTPDVSDVLQALFSTESEEAA